MGAMVLLAWKRHLDQCQGSGGVEAASIEATVMMV